MLSKFIIAALAASVSAQSGGLQETLSSLPQLQNLTTYLSFYSALLSQLSSAQNVTLLAPNNAAFEEALSGSAGAAFAANDTSLIQAFFEYHVLNGTYHASAITEVIPNITFLPTALTRASNHTLLDPATVGAFRTETGDVRFTSGLLTESTVVSANHNFSSGTIHIIDRLLTLPQNVSTTAVALNLTSAAGALRKAGAPRSFGILPSNLTAFIPNNEAFQAVANVINELPAENLTAILGYHLIPNMTLYSTDLTNETLPTFNSAANVTITNFGDEIFINQARVVAANILIEEGVLHVIDGVINPDNATATPVRGETSGAAAFPSATSGAITLTSGIPAPSTVPGSEASATGAGGAESSSSSDFAAPMITGAVGMGALLGAGAAVFNL
jgi:uncharacterized surface protein with fasciclin (FAS1) repeats